MEENLPSTDAPNEAAAVPFPEFQAGLPAGRFRIIVNPEKAHRYIRHKLYINGISVPLMGLGIGIVLWGYIWPGLCVAGLGMALRKIVKTQAPHILLHLVQRDPKIYYESIEYEVMEVRYARD